MTTLYLDHHGLELRHDRASLVIYRGGVRERDVPMALVERVVAVGAVTLSTAVLAAMAERGVGLVAISPRRPRRIAATLGPPHGDARIRLAQYAVYGDPGQRRAWARLVVRRKLLAQARFLARAQRQRPDRRKPLGDGIATLANLIAKLRATEDASLDWLRGIEGAGAAAYFRALPALFPPSLAFTGRNRRPPRDPVNACLSLAYTLLHYETVQAAHGAGLDPFVGAFHEPAFGRESLACDLVEPFRPAVDAWIWTLFRERRLRAENFRRDRDACFLGKAGRRLFYADYEQWIPALRHRLRRRCRGLVRALRAANGSPATAPPDEPHARALS